MSLRGIVEIIVHIESFRNVDLSHQGVYYIRCSLYHLQNSEVKKN
jgi:hypothetical protein